MSSLGKWIAGIVILVVFVAVANGARTFWKKASKDMVSPDGKHTVLDGFTGKLAVDKYLEIKDKEPTFNFPTIRTGVMMFQTSHGRFPNSLDEVVNEGDLSPDVIRDQHGVPYQMRIEQRDMILTSAGADKVFSTTDDVEYKLNL
ncbi:MAG: hypothetical protein GC154_21085 [bacterium]|nr:hypothetical protein [bacterium]